MKKLLIYGIPDEVHKGFRIMCVQKEVSASREIVRLMTEALRKFDKAKKIEQIPVSR